MNVYIVYSWCDDCFLKHFLFWNLLNQEKENEFQFNFVLGTFKKKNQGKKMSFTIFF